MVKQQQNIGFGMTFLEDIQRWQKYTFFLIEIFDKRKKKNVQGCSTSVQNEMRLEYETVTYYSPSLWNQMSNVKYHMRSVTWYDYMNWMNQAKVFASNANL